ncbi:hypothetical protein CLMAG_56160 [Clostridium magnum DSM 2767]|uniref:Uncharacterized protein n=1 Tax=Clostridium magnum DSM 2767 TaxID=1121326 RepID=A0A161W1S2_9CLOT|nr:hypothetical protein CLMAG_56160 [Clostridium magnum DSM 2767]
MKSNFNSDSKYFNWFDKDIGGNSNINYLN